jgi:hypothetical protein
VDNESTISTERKGPFITPTNPDTKATDEVEEQDSTTERKTNTFKWRKTMSVRFGRKVNNIRGW